MLGRPLATCGLVVAFLTACQSGTNGPRDVSTPSAGARSEGGRDANLRAAAARGNLASLDRSLQSGVDVDAADRDGTTPLMMAADAGRPAALARLLEAGADVTLRDRHGETALHHARDGRTTGLLLEAGADWRWQDDRERTPLMIAAAAGAVARIDTLLADPRRVASDPTTQLDLDAALAGAAASGQVVAVDRLLAAGARPDRPVPPWGTALHAAAASDEPAMVERFTAAGLDLETRALDTGWTPLMAASSAGAARSVAALLAAGADPQTADSEGHTAIWLACVSDRGGPAIGVLLTGGADVDVVDREGATPLMVAARYQDAATVRRLLDSGPALEMRDKHGRTAIMFAASRNGPTRGRHPLEVLLASGADPDERDDDGRPALAHAANHGGPREVSLLLRGGADPAAVGWTTLHVAAVTGDRSGLRAAARGGDVDARDVWRRTALMWLAGATGREAMVTELLAAGASPDAVDGNDATALIIATRRSDRKVIESLLAGGAPVNTADLDGMTALMYAVRRSDGAPLVQLLLESGADPNHIDAAGNTALMYAAAVAHVEAVELLVRAGTDRYVVDHHGRTAGDLAREARGRPGWRRTVELLEASEGR